MTMTFIILFILSLISDVSCTHRHIINHRTLNRSVNKSVTIRMHLVNIKYEILLENHGPNHIGGFLFTVEPQLASNVVHEEAFVVDELFRKPLKVTEAEVEGHDNYFRYIHLNQGLAPRKSVKIEINAVFARCLKPYPTYITQHDKQLVTIRMSHYFFSPYCTDVQTTKITLSTPNILSYTYKKPSRGHENIIELGPYTGMTPFNESAMMIHFENKYPIIIATKLERTIEISHWGNIAITQKISLENIGAILRGPFSRLEWSRRGSTLNEGVSLDSITAILPDLAKDFYYIDDLGNISTSNNHFKDDAVYLDLRLRFPLYGGWKISFSFGYNVPSYRFLYNNNEDFVLKMPLLDDLFEEMAIDEMQSTIILPEGVSDIDLATPFYVDRLPDKKYFTYLDIVGRTAVRFEMKNLTGKHAKEFELYYIFPKLMMIVEPILLICACFIIITFYLPIRKLLEVFTLDFSEAKPRKKRN